MDQSIFVAINSIRSPWLNEIMNIGTMLGSFGNMIWIIAFFALVLFLVRKYEKPVLSLSRPELIELIASLLIGYIICGLIVTALKFGLQMPRPYMIYGTDVLHSLESPDSPFSFPSGHSAFAMLVAATLWRFFGLVLKMILVVMVVWIGISRVNLGMHFPIDVIAGYLVGLFGAWCAFKILERVDLYGIKNRF